jgi:CPA1 family monovalent cation:H+ antiporter
VANLKRLMPPVPILMVLLGLAAHTILGKSALFTLNPTILGFFLPALIFEAAWDFDTGLLRRVWAPILVLAFPGVIITAFLVACGVALTGNIAMTSALVLGAIVSATDPVAVLALFRRLRMPHALLAVVEGESVVNDGVAIVLTQILLSNALGEFHGDILGTIIRALAVVGGGVFIGASAAIVLGFAFGWTRSLWAWVVITVVLAYGTYGAASFIGFSGIFAVVAAGLFAPACAGLPVTSDVNKRIEGIWDAVAFIANAVVFFLVGLNITFDGIFHSPLVPVAALVATLVARSFLAYGLLPLRSLPEGNLAWRHTVALAGLRGGLSLALALGLPLRLPARETILDAVFAIVFVTSVVQGTLLEPLLRKLRFVPGE